MPAVLCCAVQVQVVQPSVRAYLYTWGEGRVTAEGEHIPGGRPTASPCLLYRFWSGVCTWHGARLVSSVQGALLVVGPLAGCGGLMWGW